MPIDDNSPLNEQSRAEHLARCKQRALEYVDRGELVNAMASMGSDLPKHPAFAGERITQLGVALMMMGDLDTPEKMRKWIEGYR
jgi:hypothetical protein